MAHWLQPPTQCTHANLLVMHFTLILFIVLKHLPWYRKGNSLSGRTEAAGEVRNWLVTVCRERSLHNQEKEIIASDLLYNFKCLFPLKCLFNKTCLTNNVNCTLYRSLHLYDLHTPTEIPKSVGLQLGIVYLHSCDLCWNLRWMLNHWIFIWSWEVRDRLWNKSS